MKVETPEKQLAVSTDSLIQTDQKKRKKRLVAVILLLIVFLIGGLWYFHQKDSKPKYDGHAYNDPVKKGKSWTTGDLVIPGFGEVPVNKGSDHINITLGNSKLNQAYFKYKVQVKQKNKNVTIENSNFIKPGNAITKIPTKKLTMSPGKYPMKITVRAFSLKNKNAPLNGSIVDATLVIQ